MIYDIIFNYIIICHFEISTEISAVISLLEWNKKKTENSWISTANHDSRNMAIWFNFIDYL